MLVPEIYVLSLPSCLVASSQAHEEYVKTQNWRWEHLSVTYALDSSMSITRNMD